jgi:hypothetical protein
MGNESKLSLILLLKYTLSIHQLTELKATITYL